MAAAAKKKGGLVSALDSSAAFDSAVEESGGKLVVVDVHAEWAGPVTAVDAVYRRAAIELDAAESRLHVYTVAASLLTPEQRAAVGLPAGAGCRPLFVVYRNRVVLGRVHGANGPELWSLINENVAPLDEDAAVQ